MEASTPESDAMEESWWDANAAHIERIWGLSEPLCRGARRRYIYEIREKFLKMKPKRPLRILEVACGTGWPGRLLASSALNVTGADFSEGQIQIAQLKAIESGQVHCDYLHMDINKMGDSFKSGEFDGAFVHCGIHHLSTAELVGFANVLSQSPKGYPVILVEPVYLDRANFFGRLLGGGLARLVSLIQRALGATKAPKDSSVTQYTEELIQKATDSGWFFSPKEVPFAISEIHTLFSRDFEIKEIEPVTYFALAAAQSLATLEAQDEAARIGERILPVLDWIDSWLIRIGILPIVTSNYLFSRVVLVRR